MVAPDAVAMRPKPMAVQWSCSWTASTAEAAAARRSALKRATDMVLMTWEPLDCVGRERGRVSDEIVTAASASSM